MRVADLSRAELEELAEAAMIAFWRVVAERYPEIRTGDFPPDAEHEFASAAELAIRRWLDFNPPARADHEGRLLTDPDFAAAERRRARERGRLYSEDQARMARERHAERGLSERGEFLRRWYAGETGWPR
jgi:hypothetical protein